MRLVSKKLANRNLALAASEDQRRRDKLLRSFYLPVRSLPVEETSLSEILHLDYHEQQVKFGDDETAPEILLDTCLPGSSDLDELIFRLPESWTMETQVHEDKSPEPMLNGTCVNKFNPVKVPIEVDCMHERRIMKCFWREVNELSNELSVCPFDMPPVESLMSLPSDDSFIWDTSCLDRAYDKKLDCTTSIVEKVPLKGRPIERISETSHMLSRFRQPKDLFSSLKLEEHEGLVAEEEVPSIDEALSNCLSGHSFPDLFSCKQLDNCFQLPDIAKPSLASDAVVDFVRVDCMPIRRHVDDVLFPAPQEFSIENDLMSSDDGFCDIFDMKDVATTKETLREITFRMPACLDRGDESIIKEVFISKRRNEMRVQDTDLKTMADELLDGDNEHVLRDVQKFPSHAVLAITIPDVQSLSVSKQLEFSVLDHSSLPLHLVEGFSPAMDRETLVSLTRPTMGTTLKDKPPTNIPERSEVFASSAVRIEEEPDASQDSIGGLLDEFSMMNRFNGNSDQLNFHNYIRGHGEDGEDETLNRIKLMWRSTTWKLAQEMTADRCNPTILPAEVNCQSVISSSKLLQKMQRLQRELRELLKVHQCNKNLRKVSMTAGKVVLACNTFKGLIWLYLLSTIYERVSDGEGMEYLSFLVNHTVYGRILTYDQRSFLHSLKSALSHKERFSTDSPSSCNIAPEESTELQRTKNFPAAVLCSTRILEKETFVIKMQMKHHVYMTERELEYPIDLIIGGKLAVVLLQEEDLLDTTWLEIFSHSLLQSLGYKFKQVFIVFETSKENQFLDTMKENLLHGLYSFIACNSKRTNLFSSFNKSTETMRFVRELVDICHSTNEEEVVYTDDTEEPRIIHDDQPIEETKHERFLVFTGLLNNVRSCSILQTVPLVKLLATHNEDEFLEITSASLSEKVARDLYS